MDISKLRKKHKEAQGKPESKEPEEQPEELSEEAGEPEEPDEEVAAPESPDAGHEEEQEDEEAEEDVVKPAKPSVPEPAAAVPVPSTKEEKAADELIELVTFMLAGEYYAFRVTEVHEVLRPQFIANIPRATSFIVGVTSLRGKIIPVMDLRKRLSVGGDVEAASIVILKGTTKGIIGVLVDRTLDVIKVHESAIVHPPSHLADSEARFIEGVTSQDGQFISVIHPDELLNFDASWGGDEK